jgi:hypothetical protein
MRRREKQQTKRSLSSSLLMPSRLHHLCSLIAAPCVQAPPVLAPLYSLLRVFEVAPSPPQDVGTYFIVCSATKRVPFGTPFIMMSVDTAFLSCRQRFRGVQYQQLLAQRPVLGRLPDRVLAHRPEWHMSGNTDTNMLLWCFILSMNSMLSMTSFSVSFDRPVIIDATVIQWLSSRMPSGSSIITSGHSSMV